MCRSQACFCSACLELGGGKLSSASVESQFLFTAVHVFTLDCQVRLSACCMSLAHPSFSAHAESSQRVSQLCVCSCVSSAAAADYNATVAEGLHL